MHARPTRLLGPQTITPSGRRADGACRGCRLGPSDDGDGAGAAAGAADEGRCDERRWSRSLQEVVRLWCLGWHASALLWRCLENGEVTLQVLVQLQDGCHVPTPGGEIRCWIGVDKQKEHEIRIQKF